MCASISNSFCFVHFDRQIYFCFHWIQRSCIFSWCLHNFLLSKLLLIHSRGHWKAIVDKRKKKGRKRFRRVFNILKKMQLMFKNELPPTNRALETHTFRIWTKGFRFKHFIESTLNSFVFCSNASLALTISVTITTQFRKIFRKIFSFRFFLNFCFFALFFLSAEKNQNFYVFIFLPFVLSLNKPKIRFLFD